MADLIAIIPAKAASSRVSSKNYREFWAGLSLVELTIGKLLKADIPRENIYLSCEDSFIAGPVAHRWGVSLVRRNLRLCDNDCPIGDYIRGVVREVDVWRDSEVRQVLWAQVCDPMFDDYVGFMERWQSRGKGYDSAVVVYPQKTYMLDSNKQPIGFGFGPWHLKSQRLPVHYQLGFTASILTRESIQNVGYYVGADPMWYEAQGMMVDIDTEEDFRMAQAMYAAKMEMSV